MEYPPTRTQAGPCLIRLLMWVHLDNGSSSLLSSGFCFLCLFLQPSYGSFPYIAFEPRLARDVSIAHNYIWNGLTLPPSHPPRHCSRPSGQSTRLWLESPFLLPAPSLSLFEAIQHIQTRIFWWNLDSDHVISWLETLVTISCHSSLLPPPPPLAYWMKWYPLIMGQFSTLYSLPLDCYRTFCSPNPSHVFVVLYLCSSCSRHL